MTIKAIATFYVNASIIVLELSLKYKKITIS